MRRFEERHGELRTHPFDDEENINPDLWDFEHRTGPLVDDLVAAAREVLDVCPVDLPRLRLALAALDEASGRG